MSESGRKKCTFRRSMGKVLITNVVASTNLGLDIDFDRVTNEFGCIIKNPKMQNLIWRHPKIVGTSLIFRNGYLSVHGCKSVGQAKKSVRQFARLLQRRGYLPELNRIKINTISGVYRSGLRRLDLKKLSNKTGIWYEPEIFSAAIFTHGKIKFLIYSSGILVITGIKVGDEKKLSIGLEKLLLLLHKNRI